jgi:hypothetical protein
MRRSRTLRTEERAWLWSVKTVHAAWIRVCSATVVDCASAKEPRENLASGSCLHGVRELRVPGKILIAAGRLSRVVKKSPC